MNLVVRTKRYLREIKTPSTPSPKTPPPPPPTNPFPFLSLPLEIRIQIYTLLLVPAFDLIDILWFSKQRNYICSRLYPATSILRANQQIHREASQVFYRATLLHMGSSPGMGLPFPQRPLRRLRAVPSLGQREQKKARARDLKPEVFARFRRIRIGWLVGRMEHPGRKNEFTRRESGQGIKGLKKVLRALATTGTGTGTTAGTTSNNKRSYSDSHNLGHRTKPILYLELDWRFSDSMMTRAEVFEEYWRKEGVWDALARVHKVRKVVLGGSAYRSFGRDWTQLLT